jgi:hypothetical protein
VNGGIDSPGPGGPRWLKVINVSHRLFFSMMRGAQMLARVERALVSLEAAAAAAAAAAVVVGGSAGGGMSIGRAQPLQLSANLAPGDLGVIDVQSWLHDDAEQRQCDGLMQESDHRRYAEYAELLDYAGLLGIDPVTESGLLWVAREAMEAPVPAGWHEARDPAGNPYYYYKQPPPQSPPTAAARHAPPPPPSSAPQWSHPHDAYFRRVLRRARQATAAVAARAVGRVGPFLACLACIGWRRRASGVSCTARPIGGGGSGAIRPACGLGAGRRCTDREGLLLPRGERAQPVAASVEACGAPACVATPGPTRGVDRAGPASRCASYGAPSCLPPRPSMSVWLRFPWMQSMFFILGATLSSARTGQATITTSGECKGIPKVGQWRKLSRQQSCPSMMESVVCRSPIMNHIADAA